MPEAAAMAGKDEIYAIRGPITVFPVGNVEQHIETGKRITVAGENNSQWSLITEKMLPPDIYQRLENNLNGGNEQEPFTIMNYYMHDSINFICGLCYSYSSRRSWSSNRS